MNNTQGELTTEQRLNNLPADRREEVMQLARDLDALPEDRREVIKGLFLAMQKSKEVTA